MRGIWPYFALFAFIEGRLDRKFFRKVKCPRLAGFRSPSPHQVWHWYDTEVHKRKVTLAQIQTWPGVSQTDKAWQHIQWMNLFFVVLINWNLDRTQDGCRSVESMLMCNVTVGKIKKKERKQALSLDETQKHPTLYTVTGLQKPGMKSIKRRFLAFIYLKVSWTKLTVFVIILLLYLFWWV